MNARKLYGSNTSIIYDRKKNVQNLIFLVQIFRYFDFFEPVAFKIFILIYQLLGISKFVYV